MFRAPVNYSTYNYSISLPQPRQRCLLVILLNSVTPAQQWQMVQPNNASHFNAQRYHVNEPPSCISSGAVPFLDRLPFANERLIHSE